MKRLAFLLLSQALSLLTGLLFPILFVRLYGHAAFGDLALAASYAGLALGVLAGGLGQSILLHGLAYRRLLATAGGFVAVGAGLWTAQLLAPRGGLMFWLAAPAILSAQAALHLVYYYAIRGSKTAVFTLVFPIEALIRLAVVAAMRQLGVQDLTVVVGAYVISNACVVAGAALAVRMLGPGDDAEAAARIRPAAAWRFARWAVTGAVVDSFDRTVFATTLPAAARSPYLFFNGLYVAAFSLIANSVSLEVLAEKTRGLIGSRRGFAAIAAFALTTSGACTFALFAQAERIRALSGFDPRPVAAAVLYAFAFRFLLFVQSLSYGYMERGGVIHRTALPRVAASVILLAVSAGITALPPQALAWSSLAVVGALALSSAWWVRSAPPREAVVPT